MCSIKRFLIPEMATHSDVEEDDEAKFEPEHMQHTQSSQY